MASKRFASIAGCWKEGLLLCLGVLLFGSCLSWAGLEGVIWSGDGLGFSLVSDSGRSSLGERLVLEALAFDRDRIWVNLAPWIDERQVLAPELVGTALGRVLLEADLQLKRDVASQMLTLADRLSEPGNGVPRVWISPERVELGVEGGRCKVVSLSLKVSVEGLPDDEVRSELEWRLTQLVNSADRYADLRELMKAVFLAEFLRGIGPSPELWSVYSHLIRRSAPKRYDVLHAYQGDFFSPEEFDQEPGQVWAIGGIRCDGGQVERAPLGKWEVRKAYVERAEDVLRRLAPASGEDRGGYLLEELKKGLRTRLLETREKWQGYRLYVDSRLEAFGLDGAEADLVAYALALYDGKISPEPGDLSSLLLMNTANLVEDYPLTLTAWQLDLVRLLGLERVVKAVNAYILQREGYAFAEAREKVEEVWEGVNRTLVEMRREKGFTPSSKAKGEAEFARLMSALPDKLRALLDEVHRNRMVVADPKAWTALRDRLNDEQWAGFLTLVSLQFLSPEELQRLISRERVSAYLDALLKVEEKALSELSGSDLDEVEAFVVDGIKLCARVYPELVREKLGFKFPSPLTDQEWEAYEEEYRKVLGEEGLDNLLEELRGFAEEMKRKGKRKVVIFNATFFGGGVAEMIPGMWRFLQRFGIEVEWQIVRPRNPSRFYAVTKKMHNAIQGQEVEFSDEDVEILEAVGRDNFEIYKSWIDDPEVGAVFFEDPQVVSTLKFFLDYLDASGRSFPMAFRLHIDVSGLQGKAADSGAGKLWAYLDGVLSRLREDHSGVLLCQPYLAPPTWEGKERVFAQPPGIDILSPKNSVKSREEVEEILHRLKAKERFGRDLAPLLDGGRQVIVTGARADAWKGLLQVALAYVELVKRWEAEGRPKEELPVMVLFAGGADDDPEIKVIRPQLEALVDRYKDYIYFLWNPQGEEVGAVYRLAGITKGPVVIASVKEGYNLVIAEAIRQGALPITTNAGGLKRFETVKINGQTYPWIIDLKAPEVKRIFEEAQPKELMQEDSDVSKALVERLTAKLNEFLQEYRRNPQEYQDHLGPLTRHVFETSLLPMSRDYLKWTVEYLSKGWQDPERVVLPRYVYVMVEDPDRLGKILRKYIPSRLRLEEGRLRDRLAWFVAVGELLLGVERDSLSRTVSLSGQGRRSELHHWLALLFPGSIELGPPSEEAEASVEELMSFGEALDGETFRSWLKDRVDIFPEAWISSFDSDRFNVKMLVASYVLERLGEKGALTAVLERLAGRIGLEDILEFAQRLDSLVKEAERGGIEF